MTQVEEFKALVEKFTEDVARVTSEKPEDVSMLLITTTPNDGGLTIGATFLGTSHNVSTAINSVLENGHESEHQNIIKEAIMNGTIEFMMMDMLGGRPKTKMNGTIEFMMMDMLGGRPKTKKSDEHS